MGSFAGIAKMAAIFRGVAPEIRTGSSFLNSCFSKPRSSPSCLIIKSGYADSRISPRWLAHASNRFFMPGKRLATMRGQEIFTPPQSLSWVDFVTDFQMGSTRCKNFPASATTPRTQSQRSRSSRLFQSSKQILLAF